MRNKPTSSASCTWGDGPDVLVLVNNEGNWPIVQHKDGKYSFGLSKREALALASQLILAANHALELEDSAQIMNIDKDSSNEY